LKILLEETELAKLATVKVWIASGERLPASLFQAFHQSLPDCKLLNLYGSSEVAADATWLDCSALDSEATNVGIGNPIGTTLLVLGFFF